MRILFFGDVVGRAGRDALAAALPDLRRDMSLDAVIVNAENAANGFGLTPDICDALFSAGADAITTGNHVWDQREIIPYLDRERRVLRPANFPPATPGCGASVIQTAQGKKMLVVNLMARLYMDALDDPFAGLDRVLKQHRLGGDVQAVVVDFHGEASSEKQAMGYYADGRVSLVVGTHTHVPTADARILPQGTGYMTDAGMTGCYESVIGMEAELALYRFLRKMPGERMRPATGPVTLCGVLIETDDASGLCKTITPFRQGGVLTSSGMTAA